MLRLPRSVKGLRQMCHLCGLSPVLVCVSMCILRLKTAVLSKLLMTYDNGVIFGAKCMLKMFPNRISVVMQGNLHTVKIWYVDELQESFVKEISSSISLSSTLPSESAAVN